MVNPQGQDKTNKTEAKRQPGKGKEKDGKGCDSISAPAAEP